ncbi:SagB/ThcOx family dehydrogenase [Candidatus Sumerlaeota bacterium]|nr:SagB/ThcOx family dehydrogenase [Candidatus Sumerlaeota bacterium]
MSGIFKSILFACIIIATLSSISGAQELKDISLPSPRMKGGMPLMQALKERQTSRAFSEKKLPPQLLSDLLWAAAGINKPDSGRRTAPSARNWQEVQVYAIMREGAYHYDAKANCMRAIAKGDLRKLTGGQDLATSAPLNLVYVADLSKMKGAPEKDKELYAGADTGSISQNVYLFCASEGLATVVRALVDRKPLTEALKLSPDMKIVLIQTVGYPK